MTSLKNTGTTNNRIYGKKINKLERISMKNARNKNYSKYYDCKYE